MKVWHSVWRIAHSIILLGVVAVMIAIGVFIGRPGEKGGNQSSLAGVDQQQQKRLAVFLDGTTVRGIASTPTRTCGACALCARRRARTASLN